MAWMRRINREAVAFVIMQKSGREMFELLYGIWMEPAKADREYPLGEIIIKTGKESQEHMADTRTDELYRALQDKGYPDELCREIAYKHMNTDYTATRMLGYLYRVTSPRVEDVIDEMLAILSDREAIIRKKELEHAQATINSVYREGL